MNIKTRLLLNIFLALTISILNLVIVYQGAEKVELQRAKASQLETKLLTTTYLRANVRNQIVEAYEYIILDDGLSGDFHSAKKAARDSFADFKKVEPDTAIVDELQTIYDEIDVGLEKGIALFKNQQQRLGKKQIEKTIGDDFRKRFLVSIKREVDKIQKGYAEASHDLEAAVSAVKTNILVCSLFLIFTVGYFSIRAYRLFVSRVSQLVAALSNLGEGKDIAPIPMSGVDEISVLANRFNVMVEKIHQRTNELEQSNKVLTEVEIQLNEAIRSRDDFLSIASHELKTPLTSLLLQLQMMERGLLGRTRTSITDVTVNRDELQNDFMMVQRQITRLTELIENLLDVSRIQLGTLDLKFTEIDLTKILRESISRFMPQLTQAACDVQTQLEYDVTIFGDSGRIEQTIENLLSNIVKYAPGSRVFVQLSLVNSTAQITIIDSGPGIPKEYHEKIFQRYDRGVAVRTVGGLGLGLFIVSEVIKSHNGKIHIESDQQKGTRFDIYFPLAQLEKEYRNSMR